jgi:putative transposase
VKQAFTQIYVHVIWATWDRLPLITEDIRSRLYGSIEEKCCQLKCEPLAVGGIEDHVHVLARLHPAVSVSEFIKELKGFSSHLMTHVVLPGDFFKWQGAYGAFTIRKNEVRNVKSYILNQKTHHAEGTLNVVFEQSEAPNETTRTNQNDPSG